MSSDSLAMFRKSLGPDLAQLAEEHLQHDLTQSDRDALTRAASTVSTHTTIGSALGLTLGLALAYRLRAARIATFAHFRAHRAVDQPIAVRFANGREEAIPDLTPLLRPSSIGDIATYAFLGIGGLFLGGETGLVTGSFQARRGVLNGDRESRDRIQGAFRRFQADALRKQADALDRGADGMGM
ncbi:hypothetical protein LTR08_002217 [Meristemomyces frigidus]|nr:hypothetical protein LTR08_002217 [Meristemomyces frigidus]